MDNGYIKLHRKILDWEWYQSPNVTTVFLHCLLKANYKDKNWQGTTIKRGQFVSSVKKISEELSGKNGGLSVQQVRTAINKLKLTGELTIKTTNKYSIISIKNYDSYQDDNTQTLTQITNNQQTNNKQITTTNKEKNIKKEKNNYLCSENFDFIISQLRKFRIFHLQDKKTKKYEYQKGYMIATRKKIESLNSLEELKSFLITNHDIFLTDNLVCEQIDRDDNKSFNPRYDKYKEFINGI